MDKTQTVKYDERMISEALKRTTLFDGMGMGVINTAGLDGFFRMRLNAMETEKKKYANETKAVTETATGMELIPPPLEVEKATCVTKSDVDDYNKVLCRLDVPEVVNVALSGHKVCISSASSTKNVVTFVSEEGVEMVVDADKVSDAKTRGFQAILRTFSPDYLKEVVNWLDHGTGIVIHRDEKGEISGYSSKKRWTNEGYADLGVREPYLEKPHVLDIPPVGLKLDDSVQWYRVIAYEEVSRVPVCAGYAADEVTAAILARAAYAMKLGIGQRVVDPDCKRVHDWCDHCCFSLQDSAGHAKVHRWVQGTGGLDHINGLKVFEGIFRRWLIALKVETVSMYAVQSVVSNAYKAFFKTKAGYKMGPGLCLRLARHAYRSDMNFAKFLHCWLLYYVRNSTADSVLWAGTDMNRLSYELHKNMLELFGEPVIKRASEEMNIAMSLEMVPIQLRNDNSQIAATMLE